MKFTSALLSYISSASVLASGYDDACKVTPADKAWPSERDWLFLNKTLGGTLIQGIPPGSVCYPDQPNYSQEACDIAIAQWTNSTWHATNPVSIDYPIWTNNSCNPIFPNGTSVTGDPSAGSRGCSIGSYPAYVVDAKHALQIASALVWAGEKNIRVVVKSTGHSFPGRSIGYGSLSIWTHHLTGIEVINDFKPRSCPVDISFPAARVAAGETGVSIVRELAKYNLTVVTGANPDVGIVGWLTGAGHGFLSRDYGMGADNLLEATIVTPDGKTLLANPCQNSDIFFAIRGGGGGTYGVVTEVVVRAFPPPQTTIHTLQIASLSINATTEYYELLGYLHSEMQRLKDGGMQGYYYVVGPPIQPTLSFQWSFMLFDKPNGTVESLMQPINAYLQARKGAFAYLQNITAIASYTEIFQFLQNEQVGGGGGAIGSRLLSPKSLEDANITARIFAEIGPNMDAARPNAPVVNTLLIGHMVASPHAPSYYPEVSSVNPAWRNTVTHFIVSEPFPGGLPQSKVDSIYHDVTWKKIEPLRQLSPETGAYFNEPDSYEPNWQKAFFGDNYGKLLSVKKRYDTKNVLWCRRCVGSEVFVEQIDGRLCRA